MVKVVLVDDHDLVRMGIRRLLDDTPDVEIVGEANSGETAISEVGRTQPDVVLMDLKMPGIGGLEATRRISTTDPSSRVIILTAYGDDPFPARLMQAGASGYLTKGTGLEEMVVAIRTVASGQRYLSPSIAQKLALTRFNDAAGSPLEALSDREMQIALMIVNCHKVQAISDILCLSPKTVNTYRYRIFEKLEISSDVELTRLAMRHGLLDQEPAEHAS